MFKEHDINGEQGLLYLLKDSEVLQSFHLAMLTTNPHIGAIPLQCTYVENHEAIYYKTGHLISVERYLHENRVIHLSWIMKGLAETVKQLMGHQLFPENMCLDSRYVFLDLQSRKVHLIYIPLKSQLYEAKSKLVTLLRQWLDLYVNQNSLSSQGGADFSPMMMKLVLSLQQETTSFSSLLDIMSELGLQTSEKERASQLASENSSGNLGAYGTLSDGCLAQSPEILKEAIKREYDMRAPINAGDKKIQKEKKSFKVALPKRSQGDNPPNAKKVLIFTTVAIALAGILLSPLAFETKLGGLLIIGAGSVWCLQKFKLFDPKGKQTLKSSTPKRSVSNEIQPSYTPYAQNSPNQVTGEYPCVKPSGDERLGNSPVQPPIKAVEIGKAEETLWIDQNSKNGVLMMRSELGSKFVTLSKEVTTLGRNPSLCDVMIDEAGVGRIHAEIHKNDDKYYIKDIQSLNGSFVNGKKIPSNQYYELKTGDQIKIGSKEVIFT